MTSPLPSSSPQSPTPSQAPPSAQDTFVLQKIQSMTTQINATVAAHTKAVLETLGHAQTYNRERIARLQQQVDSQDAKIAAQGKEIAALKALVASLLQKPAA